MRSYYTDIPKSPGIYIWINSINGKRYIGSAKNLYNRVGIHLRKMRCGNNDCGALQAAYNKYGENPFEFRVLLICEEFELLRYEQWFIDNLKPEYNKRLIANSNLGLKMSEETKEKHRIKAKSRYPKEMIESTRINHYMKGKSLSPITIEKIRQTILAQHRKHTTEERNRQSRNQLGIVHYFKILQGVLISPDGQEFTNIENLEKFGREHGIDKRRMSEFLNGKRISWKGWKYVATWRT